MIDKFVTAWDKNKDKLKNFIATHRQEEYDSYLKLLKLILKIIINPYEEIKYDINNIREINDGDY